MSTRPGKTQARAGRVLAVLAYVGVLGLGATFLLARRAAASLAEQTSFVGRELDGFAELGGSVTEVALNGQALVFSAIVVERSRDDVLARFGALCDEALGELPTALAARVDASAEPALLQRVLAPRGVASDGSGSAACFAGLGEDGLAGLLGRARAFSATHDLSRLGKLRVAFVRPLAPRRSRVLLVTADGPVHLPALLARGKVDVPGSDPLPLRPKSGVRVLSAEVRGTPHAVAAYRVAAPLRPALTAYTTALRGAGFERSVDLTPAVDADAEPTRSMLSEAYRRGHEAYVITASPDGAGSLLSVLRLGREAIPGPFAPSPGAFDDPALPSGARSLRR